MDTIPAVSWEEISTSLDALREEQAECLAIPEGRVAEFKNAISGLRAFYFSLLAAVSKLRDSSTTFKKLADHDFVNVLGGYGGHLGLLDSKDMKDQSEIIEDFLGVYDPEYDKSPVDQTLYKRLYEYAVAYCEDEVERPVLSVDVQEDLKLLEKDENTLVYLKKRWKDIEELVQKTRTCIRDLLFVTEHALESGSYWVEGFKLPVTEIPISELVGGVEHFVRQRFDGSMRVECDVQQDLSAFGHPGTIVNLLMNMIRNARNHGKAKNVEITLQEIDESVELIIEDDGKGVDIEPVERIFEEGFSGGKSSGLGLALASERLAVMEATINCEPHGGINGGAKFVMRFKKTERNSMPNV